MLKTAPPYSVVLGLGVAALLLYTAGSEIRDVDVYWHLLAGEELAEGISPSEVGSGWSYAQESLPWTSTQWLFELLMYRIHQIASWEALAAFRLVTAAVVLGLLARTTLRGRPAALAAFPFLTAAFLVGIVAQERPQQITWIGAAVLGGVLVRGLDGSLPRWWLLLLGTVLWANLHGGWILVPGILILIAVVRLMDAGLRDAAARRAGLLGLAATACGALTPAGMAGWTAAIRFAGATDHIIEWQATEPFSGPGSVTVIMLGLAMVGWSRPTRTPPSEFLVVLILIAFSWSAWRNMVPALLMLAPVVARRLTLAFPSAAVRSEPKWSAPIGIAISAAALMLGLVSISGREHLPYEEQPIELAQMLGGLGTDERVLNDYNVAGATLYFGGPRVQVGIDGRADRYPASYSRNYLDMVSLRGNWEELLDELQPTSVLLERDAPLAHVLTTERGWSVAGEKSGFVLLLPTREVTSE